MAEAPYRHRDYRRAKVAFAGHPCVHCGAPSDSVDHLIPLAEGGALTADNLAPSCRRCNFSRGARQSAVRRKRRVRRGRPTDLNPTYFGGIGG